MISKIAAGYAYDSLRNSKNLEEQKKEIEKYCEDNDFSLQCVYVASKIEGKSREEAFKEFVEKLPESIRFIIVSRIEGVTRRYQEFNQLENMLDGKKIILIQAENADIDFSYFYKMIR